MTMKLEGKERESSRATCFPRGREILRQMEVGNRFHRGCCRVGSVTCEENESRDDLLKNDASRANELCFITT